MSLLNAFDLNNKIHKNLQEKVLDNNIIENLAFNYIDLFIIMILKHV